MSGNKGSGEGRGAVRAILYASVCGAGLWAVAGGLLSHHPTLVKVGGVVAIVAALAFFATPADASNFDYAGPSISMVWYATPKPPKALQANADFPLALHALTEVTALCANHGAEPAFPQACLTPEGRVIAPNPCTYPDSDAYARLLCHELGHVNGWPANHPNPAH